MRTLCLILILANALFFVWSQLLNAKVNSFDRPVASAATPPPRIVLAREIADQDQSADESDVAPSEMRNVDPPRVEPVGSNTPASAQLARTDPLACTSIGPFADLPQSAQAQAALRSAGFQPRQRMEQGELWVGYWVSVQSLATRAAAEKALKSLSDSGITDVYLMPGSDPANVLSLGVFSDYQRAQRRADEVRALGLEPRIDDRKRSGSVYWIDVDLPEPGKLIDTSILQTDPGRILRLEMRGCPASDNG